MAHNWTCGKKVPEDSDWLFGDNVVSRINQIKAKQQALKSDGFKNSKNLQGFSKSPENRQYGYYIPETTNERTEQQQLPSKPAKEILSSEEVQILKQVNKYELSTKFMGQNTKLVAENWKKLTDKYIWDIVTNGLRLDFEEFPENIQYHFRQLNYDEQNIVKPEVDKLLSN